VATVRYRKKARPAGQDSSATRANARR
jgi:hypothetical protein